MAQCKFTNQEFEKTTEEEQSAALSLGCQLVLNGECAGATAQCGLGFGKDTTCNKAVREKMTKDVCFGNSIQSAVNMNNINQEGNSTNTANQANIIINTFSNDTSLTSEQRTEIINKSFTGVKFDASTKTQVENLIENSTVKGKVEFKGQTVGGKIEYTLEYKGTDVKSSSSTTAGAGVDTTGDQGATSQGSFSNDQTATSDQKQTAKVINTIKSIFGSEIGGIIIIILILLFVGFFIYWVYDNRKELTALKYYACKNKSWYNWPVLFKRKEDVAGVLDEYMDEITEVCKNKSVDDIKASFADVVKPSAEFVQNGTLKENFNFISSYF